MSQTQTATVNGDMPHSATLSHIHSYPAVSDSVSYLQSQPPISKTIEVTNSSYAKFVKPNLHYIQTPVSYVAPYAAKADQLGDQFLTKVDEKVPILKSETKEIQGTVWSYISWPLVKTNETKDWAFQKYSQEYKKCGGDGYLAGGKAMVTTPLVLSSEVLQWLSSFLQRKQEEASQQASQVVQQVKDQTQSK